MENKEDANYGEVTNKEETNDKKEEREDNQLPLMALNHVSRLCRNVKDSVDFYTKVLGFVLIIDHKLLTLMVHGYSIMVLGFTWCKPRMKIGFLIMTTFIPWITTYPFSGEDMEAIEQRLKDLNIKYMKRIVGDESGTTINQLFFNDPDGFMIERCNCGNLKLVPAGSLGKMKLPFDRHNPLVELNNGDDAKSK